MTSTKENTVTVRLVTTDRDHSNIEIVYFSQPDSAKKFFDALKAICGLQREKRPTKVSDVQIDKILEDL